ncbi:dynein light chain 1, axonemal [Cyclospora cayetanensis]|uniref:Dynein axonemal light chain 1 n=1 Tax=Cyclospora cayetanensis TaxID=88456 RepID=A0A6P6S2A4_9EIME|nr:dynein light chain 1, axonemal [Cyclospora cayetanensis]
MAKAGGGTSCLKAIQLFEEKTGLVAAEAEEVKLIAQLPPLEKMDSSLNALVACKKLSLSTNSIEKISNLSNLKKLEILSLGRNVIKKISGLEDVGATLRQLWLSYNQIEKLDGLQPCVKLEVLFMSNNKVKSWEEIEKLATLPSLVNVLFKGNPVYDSCSTEEIRCSMLKRLPKLNTLDGETVSVRL